MKSSPKNNLLLLSLISAAAAIAAVMFFILPYQDKFKMLSQKISEQRANLEFISKQKQSLYRLEREIKEIEAKQQAISPSVFAKNQTLELITSLENISQNRGLISHKLNLSEPTLLANGFSASNLNFEITATYNNLIIWLNEIEKQPYYVIIDNINISTSNSARQDADESNNIQAALSAKIYWQ